jgi:hypothetical protein|tara:strand:+ start:72 stop:224 length:153 start_codon:yes stop_codon:yes gene_type:complete
MNALKFFASIQISFSAFDSDFFSEIGNRVSRTQGPPGWPRFPLGIFVKGV